VTRLQAGQRESRCSSLSLFRDFSVSQCVHIKFGSHPVRIRLVPGCVSLRYKGRSMKLITRLILVPGCVSLRYKGRSMKLITRLILVPGCVSLRYKGRSMKLITRLILVPGCVSLRYKGRSMKLITRLVFVSKAMKHRRYTSTRSLLVVDCFANTCFITLMVLEIQSAIRGKTAVLTQMLELLSCCTGLEYFH